MTSKRHFSNYSITFLAVSVLALLALTSFVQFVPQAHASVETDFMATLNAERATLGKAPIAINPSLTTASYLHSKDMGDNNYFSHTSLDGTTFDRRIVAAGYTGWYSLGENIAYAYGSPNSATVYSMWKNSAGHYANMMGDFNEAGLGVYSIRGYTYYTLDLGKRSNPTPPPQPTADFSLSTTQNTLSIQAGSAGTSTAIASSLNGFSGIVTLSTSTPTGWTATTNPTTLTISSGTPGSATITVAVPSGTPAGTYLVTLTGTSGSTSHTTTIAVNVQAPPPAQTAPSAPQNLRATAGNAQVILSWSAPLTNGGSAVTGYTIYKRTATTAETPLATVGNVLSYTDTAVSNGQTYIYRVAAVNAVGESGKSTEATATPTAPAAGTLNLAVTTDKQTYTRGTSILLTITVKDGVAGTALRGAYLTIQFFGPSGASLGSVYVTTGSSGTVLGTIGFSGYAPTGTYTIRVTASLTGYQSRTEQTTFAIA